MTYDQLLATRSRKVLCEHQGVSELQMSGGIAFKLGDHMFGGFGGIVGKDLIVRLGVRSVLDEPMCARWISRGARKKTSSSSCHFILPNAAKRCVTNP